MLQISWMSPHKLDPPSSPVEVDLSEILIPPEGLKRAESSRELESGNSFSQWNDSTVSELHGRIGSSGWTNIIFAVTCCVVAIFCALSIFDNVEYFRRAVHPPTDVAYRRPDSSSATSPSFSLQRSLFAAAPRRDHSIVNSLAEQTDSSNYSPTLSTFQPFREDRGLALLPSNGGIADRAPTNNSSSAPSAGVAMESMSRERSSTDQSSSGEERTTAERSSPRTGTRHAQKLIFSSRTRISRARQRLRPFFANRLRNSSAGKSNSRVAARTSSSSLKFGAHNGQWRTAAAQTMPGRRAIATHSMAGAVGTTQNRGAINCMPMQHGMLAPPALGGLGGLNSAGLGGAGNHGGNARR
jgi:hypothetical protein